MISYHELVNSLKQFKIGYRPVIVHVWLPAFGAVRGGAATLLGGLLTLYEDLIMPSFTYRTMVVPETGPANNGIEYGTGKEINRTAEIFHRGMSVDEALGQTAEHLRRHPHSLRSKHPILSFSGINLDRAIQSQTIQDPLLPIKYLVEQDGWVLLMGVSHTSNFSIHYAEKLEGRKQFIRWALTREGVQECPSFPGCSRGFNQVTDLLSGITIHAPIGNAVVRAIPLQPMMEVLTITLHADPLALLCSYSDCVECSAVRKSLGVHPVE